MAPRFAAMAALSLSLGVAAPTGADDRWPPHARVLDAFEARLVERALPSWKVGKVGVERFREGPDGSEWDGAYVLTAEIGTEPGLHTKPDGRFGWSAPHGVTVTGVVAAFANETESGWSVRYETSPEAVREAAGPDFDFGTGGMPAIETLPPFDRKFR